MAITIRIDGDDYLVADGTLQTSLQLGLGGSQLQFGLVPGQGYPPLLKKVILNLAGIDFEGKLTDDGRDSANTHIGTRTYTAIGKQYRLDRNTDVEFRGLTSVTDIANEMLFGSGVPGVVIGTARNLRGYRFKGPLKAGLQDLAIKGKYMLFLAPDSVELIDRDDPPAAPFNWIYGVTSGWRNFNPRKSSERPYNRIVIEGGVPKKSDSDPDEEEIEVPYAGDGIRKRFGYPKTTDEIFDLTVDGESKTICQEGDPEQEAFDAYNDRGNYEVVFATAPATGAEIILSCRIQRARGVWNDTASQAEEAEDGGDGFLELVKSMPEIRTQLEAEEAAAALGAVIGVPKVEASAEVWAQEGIFKPGRTVVQSWPAEAWNETLSVQQTTLTYRSDLGGWIQQVHTGNGKDGEVTGSTGSATGLISSGFLGGAGPGTGSLGNQITEKLPPTETSPAVANQDFNLTVTPETQNVTDGDSDPIDFTIGVEPVNGFNRSVTLSTPGLELAEATWIPNNVVTGGNGSRTLRLTPTGGTWVTGNAGTFQVQGTNAPLTRTANGEIVVEEDTGCESTGYSYSVEEFECFPSNTPCCSLPLENEGALQIPWTVTFFDNCDVQMGSASGTASFWRNAGCEVFRSGNTYMDPDGNEQTINCDCENA